MDEPLSNLDAQLRQEMRREIRALQQQLGMTMVYVTHDQTEAMSMADQVVLLRAGRIEQDAPPAELYARPASVFAARFIGTPPMNIVAAPGRRRPASSASGPSTCASSSAAACEAVVQSAEYLGADTVVTCSTSAGGMLADTVAARLPGRYDARRGHARCASAWAAEDSPLFDHATGRRRDDVVPVPA